MQKVRAVAPFEHYMAADDRGDYPMIFWLVLSFRGQVDEARLKTSANLALKRHPLLRSLLKGNPKARRSDLYWCEIEEPTIYTYVAYRHEPFLFPQENSVAIDLTQEPGVRLFVRQLREESVWYLQFHHSATDGTGALCFAEDLMSAYTEGEAFKLRSMPAVDALDARIRCGLNWTSVLRSCGDYFLAVLRYFGNDARPMKESQSAGLVAQSCNQVPERERVFFEEAALGRLKLKAKKLGVTINDLLLAQLFRSLDQWHLKYSSRKCVRVAVPVNLRSPREVSMSAANMMGMAFVDRSGSILGDRKKLIGSLSRQMRRIKGMRLAYGLNFAIDLAGYVQGAVVWLCQPRLRWKCSATAVLSNLGEVWKNSTLPKSENGEILLPGLHLKTIELLPPLRFFTNMSIGVVTYAGRLCLTAHFDHTLLQGEEVKKLLNHMCYDLRVNLKQEEEAKAPLLSPLLDT